MVVAGLCGWMTKRAMDLICVCQFLESSRGLPNLDVLTWCEIWECIRPELWNVLL